MTLLLDADDVGVATAARIITDGGLVAFPTETVYGLGADAANEDAIRRVFEAKGRPADHPVIVHLCSVDQLGTWLEVVSVSVRSLAERFWPGPLTIVAPKPASVSSLLTGGQPTVGVRIPDHRVALRLISESGTALAAPSANRFGGVSPTTADHVMAGLAGRIDAVVDGGPCRVGVESTIVEVTGGGVTLLRPGRITVDDLQATLGVDLVVPSQVSRAPGTLSSHYAPAATVVVAHDGEGALRAAAACEGRGERYRLLGLSGALPDSPMVLESFESVEAYAHGLYAALREADRAGIEVVVAVVPGPEGLAAAVTDRLMRASGGASVYGST